MLLVAVLAFPSAASAEPAEAQEREHGLGVAVSSALNGEVLPFRLIPSALYYRGLHQFELGVGFHPFIRKDQTIISSDFNYKLFPNGHGTKFKTYLLGNFSYLNVSRETFYPTTYHYLFLHVGYGLELAGFAGSYMDTNVSFGAFTYSKNSENPATTYLNEGAFFRDFGMSMSLQVNVGYRF